MPEDLESNAAAIVASVAAAYRQLGDPARAAAEKRYLKSALQFHGVSVPQVRRQGVRLSATVTDRRQLRALADAFFASEFHDLRSTGIAVLERRQALLGPADLPYLIARVRRSPGWAHVDWLVTKVIGPVVARAPAALRRRTLRAWGRDRDLWVRRAALLAQLDELRAGGGDFELFAAVATPLLSEKEFFIRKAIGWVLREVGHRRPRLAFEFLRVHRAELSGLTLREGARRLPPALRARLSEG